MPDLVLYRVIQNCSRILKEIVGQIIGNKNYSIFFSDSSSFPSDDVFTLMSLCVIVIVWREFRVKTSWKYSQLKYS
jgi:hypothetical protein